MSDEIKSVKPIDSLRLAVKLGAEGIKGYGLPIFIGGINERQQVILEAAQLFYSLEQLRENDAKGKLTDKTILTSLEVRYKEHIEKHFEGASDKELGELLMNYFTFFNRGLDRLSMRNELVELINPERMQNELETAHGQFGLIQPARSGSMKGLSMKDRMRKNFGKAAGAPDGFSVMLMNSRVFLRIKLPTPMDLLLLINKIAEALTGFGQRTRLTSLELERALITREIMNFVIEHASYWSVSDILDARELFQVIKAKDADVLATAILAASSPKGVNYRLTCLADKCNYVGDHLLDAANLTQFDAERYPDVYMTQVKQILNKGTKFSIEELKASEVPYVDVDGTTIDNVLTLQNGLVTLELSDPYLSDYFECFDNAAERINPELRKLAVQFSDAKRYKEARKNFMGSIRTVNYLQWVSKMTFHAEPGSGEEDEVFLRSNNPKEFDEGLLDCLGSEEELSALFLEKIIKVVPRMSYTTVGLLHDECPSCKGKSEAQSEMHRGFTPIDPVLSFFDHTQILIALRRELGTLQEDVLS